MAGAAAPAIRHRRVRRLRRALGCSAGSGKCPPRWSVARPRRGFAARPGGPIDSNLGDMPPVQSGAMSATLTWHPTLTLDQRALPQSLETSDAVLAARGDAQAFRRLYEENVDRVHALARRMVGYEQAPELTQDVFVRAWQKLHTFRGEARFS